MIAARMDSAERPDGWQIATICGRRPSWPRERNGKIDEDGRVYHRVEAEQVAGDDRECFSARVMA